MHQRVFLHVFRVAAKGKMHIRRVAINDDIGRLCGVRDPVHRCVAFDAAPPLQPVKKARNGRAVAKGAIQPGCGLSVARVRHDLAADQHHHDIQRPSGAAFRRRGDDDIIRAQGEIPPDIGVRHLAKIIAPTLCLYWPHLFSLLKYRPRHPGQTVVKRGDLRRHQGPEPALPVDARGHPPLGSSTSEQGRATCILAWILALRGSRRF